MKNLIIKHAGQRFQIWQNADTGDINRLSVHRIAPNGRKKFIGTINRSGAAILPERYWDAIEANEAEIRDFMEGFGWMPRIEVMQFSIHQTTF